MTERQTGTKDVTYNLISVAYHALQGAETNSIYLQDAEKRGDTEIADFFRSVIDEDRRRADRAKELLKQRMR
ncbi:MAG: hypothetical protein KatS3mg057_1069 [Herpetosiphonaceae bacterium]|nr:MAG: hypothetical protein KatS3mg057_1069 [Herpetosiphonaceae bacterium]